MTALAQGAAGLALVMGFALLCIRQVGTAAILLAVQCVAVAVSASVLHQPLMAVPPLLLAAGVWFAAERAAVESGMVPELGMAPEFGTVQEAGTVPVGGAKFGVGAAVVLAILCQSQGVLALPLTVVLLAILFAATRQHALMHVMALVGLQNGLVLGACLVGVGSAGLLPVACLLLPLPLLASLLVPALTQRQGRAAGWAGWVDVAVSLAMLGATLLVPLDSVGSVFAPLLGLDGVVRALQRRQRPAMSLVGRGMALLSGGFLILAVCSPNPVVAWVAVLGAITSFRLPTLTRSWDDAVLAFIGAAVTLFGVLLLAAGPLVLGYFSLFAGSVMIAAVVPDLAVVLVILILRLGNQAAWPPAGEALCTGFALVGLGACAWLLATAPRCSRVTLLGLSQSSLAALAVGTGSADGRFAALVLLVLLILTRTAVRVADEPVATLARGGLGGILPLGVFPGVVLVVLAVAGRAAWVLVPVGLAAVPVVLAGLPRGVPRWPALPRFGVAGGVRGGVGVVPLVGGLALLLALWAGYAMPDAFVRWGHLVTAGAR